MRRNYFKENIIQQKILPYFENYKIANCKFKLDTQR